MVREPSVERVVPSLILLSHGTLGEELVRSAEMILGPLENVVSVSLKPGEGLAEYQAKVAEVLDGVPGGSLVMADLFGGTPSNCIVTLSKKYDVAAVSGLNLPMLIEAVTQRSRLRGSRLARAVMDSGREGIKDILEAVLGPK